MKLAIMQPYLFPYIGYFQLIGAVDQFVIHDDVQWIKGGWINRNRILVNGEPRYITLPVQKGASTASINEREFPPTIDEVKQKVMRQIRGAYQKAPHFDAVNSLLSRCFASQERNLSAFVVNALHECCRYLRLETKLVLSSGLRKDNALKGQDRVLDINSVMGATHYINPIGGTELYEKERFRKQGVTLNFLKTRNVAYKQFANREFVPSLAIIDVMMFNSSRELANLLNEYDLG
jgi:hypothetical protein